MSVKSRHENTWVTLNGRMIVILIALCGSSSLANLLYPDLAILIRDITHQFFSMLGFEIGDFNKEAIGLAFRDFAYVLNGEGEILHAGMVAGCLVTFPSMVIFADFLWTEGRNYYEKTKPISFRSIGRTILVLLCFLISIFPITLVRFIGILIVFLLIWNTPLWELHFFIGHDLIGNLFILSPILIYTYFYHNEWFISLYLRFKQRIFDFLSKISVLVKSNTN